MSQFNVYTYCSFSIVCFNKEKVLVGIFSGHCEISRSPIDSSSVDAAKMLEITRCVALIVTKGLENIPQQLFTNEWLHLSLWSLKWFNHCIPDLMHHACIHPVQPVKYIDMLDMISNLLSFFLIDCNNPHLMQLFVSEVRVAKKVSRGRWSHQKTEKAFNPNT